MKENKSLSILREGFGRLFPVKVRLGWRLFRYLLLGSIFFLVFLAPRPALGQQTFGTTIYFDYIYFLSDKGPKTTVFAPGYRNNFFQFRRAYFTYENRIGDRLRFRFPRVEC